jgi:plastocyanin
MGRLPIFAGIAAALVVTAVAVGAAGDLRIHRLHLPPPPAGDDGAAPPAAGGADASNPAGPGTTAPSPPAPPVTPPPVPPAPPAAVACSAGATGADVTGTLSDYAIALSASSVAAAPSLSFRGTYPAGGDVHNLTLRDSTGKDLCGTANLGVGAAGSFTVTNLPTGSYELVCTLHAASFGMKVPFTVS